MSLVKLCGLTREEDVRLAREAGVDLVGFVFAASPRRLTVERAARLRRLLEGSPILAVGVFAGASRAEIAQAAAAVPLDLVQLHGDLPGGAGELDMPVIRALRVRAGRIIEEAGEGRHAYYLLDAFDAGRAGGTGHPFDWDGVRAIDLPRPFLLAGGLTAENVAEGIARLRPDGVDVSSGVEVSPGIKDAARVRRFVVAARAAFAKGQG